MKPHPRHAYGTLAFALALAAPLAARAQAEPPADKVVEIEPPREARNEVPIVAYTYSAGGVDGRTVGAYGYFNFLAASKEGAVPGGGALVYGSPIDRLTFVADASRSLVTDQFAPSFAVIVRPIGKNGRGFNLGILAKYKIEGFAVGPENEVEHEMEGGFLLGYAAAGWHLDANGIVGFGLTEDREIDVEGRLRFARDLGDHLRLGLDGQVRGRASGDKLLVGNRTMDFSAGPQMLVSAGHFYGSLTAGPSITGVATGVGFTTLAAIGGTTL